MAFYQEEDENLDEFNQLPETGAVGSTISATGTAPQTTAAGPTSGGSSQNRFSGIQQYLKQNQTQGAKLGENAAQAFNKQIEDTKQNVNRSQEQFQGAVNQGLISGFDTAEQEAAGIVNQAATAPKGSNINSQRFGQIANAQYSGPNQALDTDFWKDAFKSLGKSKEFIGQTSQQGNQALISSINENPNYSAGKQTLDNLLLSGNKQNQERLNQIREEARGLEGLYFGSQETAKQTAETAKQKTEALRNAVRGNLANTQQNTLSDVQANLANQQATWQDEYNQLADVLRQSKEGAALYTEGNQANRLGINQNQRLFNSLKGLNSGQLPIENILSLENFDANRVVSQDQQAQLAALDYLSGTYGGQLVNPFTQAELAGTLNRTDALKSYLPELIQNKQEAFIAEGGNDLSKFLRGDIAPITPYDKESQQQIQKMAKFLKDQYGVAIKVNQIPDYQKNVNTNKSKDMKNWNNQVSWLNNISDYLKQAGYTNKANNVKIGMS